MIPDLSTATWRKSSYSDGGASNCVEVADSHPGTVPVRDSKNPSARPLFFSAASWSVFVDGVKGEGDVRTFV
ncbi:hypothetical protein GCM10022403_089100 [Streptomyces coacervatus]|uniref:DUF397 domain-containing protein n=1 Tax=Streptomyces coacervatus TaxID=647381 RepID=A0ABP7JFN4_9ACTN|nr:DUF397 domain-containing protein [Streptomyces coacervatus]MDF2271244.1 DUF397 domain-containing protein [Streptomyces coacervatus]